MMSLTVLPDPWHPLRRLTSARIALGRTGGSLPTRETLDFRRAHARARDAVHAPFEAVKLSEDIRGLGIETVLVESAAGSTEVFLRRPDLGRILAEESRATLRNAVNPTMGFDLVVIVSNGLSSRAAEAQAGPLLAVLLPLLVAAAWKLAPVVVATRGRVALQDEIGAILQARLSLMLLGERPGLGAADSLGAYFTFGPHPGLTDAARNCVSNIRPEGLPPAAAAHKLFYLVSESFRRGLSGVELKDDSPYLPLQALQVG